MWAFSNRELSIELFQTAVCIENYQIPPGKLSNTSWKAIKYLLETCQIPPGNLSNTSWKPVK